MSTSHVDALYVYPNVVVLGPRLQSSVEDRDIVDYYLCDILSTGLSITLRVSGMPAGPELFAERFAAGTGLVCEVWGEGGDFLKRMNKKEHLERDVSSAHLSAIWIFPSPSELVQELSAYSNFLDFAKAEGSPVFVFTKEGVYRWM